jgi:hypothetical protein
MTRLAQAEHTGGGVEEDETKRHRLERGPEERESGVNNYGDCWNPNQSQKGSHRRRLMYGSPVRHLVFTVAFSID